MKDKRSETYMEVKGYEVTTHFAVHKESSKNWWVDHLPSGYKLKKMSSRDNAETLSNEIEGMMDWSHKEAPEVFRKSEYFRDFFRHVSEAIENNEDIPVAPEVLKYNLFFIEMDEVDERWDIFLQAWNELESLIGLSDVKETIMKIMQSIRGRKINEKMVKGSTPSYHMLFKGAAGTGKTEVARIVGMLFYAIGVVPEDRFLEVGRKDLVGEHVGETAPKTEKIINQAIGGVLFIDEAYALVSNTKNDFGNEAIEVLIKAMEDHREDFVVILAGYQGEMEELMDMNEGFRSRVRLHIPFSNYTLDELAQISKEMLNSKGCELDADAHLELASYLKLYEHQGVVDGNARTVRNLIEFVIEEMHTRTALTGEATNVVIAEDLKKAGNVSNDDPERLVKMKDEAVQELDNLVGMTELKNEVRRIMNTILLNEKRKEFNMEVEKSRMHMCFTGPPGTGKTTVARIMGKFFNGSGILSSGHFVEASRGDLVAEYLGQTAPKVNRKIKQSMGGVMFIDEAYNLITDEHDYFGKEAVSTLIQGMEDYHEDLVVILAGYSEDIKNMIDVNPGFKSRIGYYFDFPDYTAEDIVEISKRLLDSKGYDLSVDASQALEHHMIDFHQDEGHFGGNGRWADEFVKLAINCANQRLVNDGDLNELTPEKLQSIQKMDIDEAMKITRRKSGAI
ncbi:AAA family ATPase [Salisediminibacterium beveridgei]|uniref:AAA family ATPase n=1 Tax=Salisediminibacterium beveridgei TaxID=632773 RepID=UPI0018DB4F3E|nr:AAA family ATPase [Salisediminibacterium beveridgei]